MSIKGSLTHRATLAVCLSLLLAACTGSPEDPQDYLQQGKALLEQGKIEEARVQFQNALQLQPALAEGHYRLALIDEKKQDWKGMYNRLTEVVRLDPQNAEAQLKLGQLYLAGREFDKAAEQASAVMQLRPDDPDAATLRAAILYARGNKAEALDAVGRVLAADATNYGAIILQSNIYFEQGRYAEALESLQRGLASTPRDIGLQQLKIRAKAANKDLTAALADYQALIEQYPENKDLKYGLVVFAAGNQRRDEAEKVLRTIIEQHPAETRAKLLLIDLVLARNPAEAETTLQEFIKASPSELALQARLADLYWEQKRHDAERAILERITQSDAKGKEGLSAQVKMARNAVKQHDGKTAERLIDNVLAVDPTQTDALMLRAAMRLDRKETDVAISDLRNVLKANPDLGPALVMLANGYLQQGHADLADGTFRKALEINPGNLDAAAPLVSKIVRERGDLNRAEQIVQNALKANPSSARGLELLARVRIARQDWKGAQAVVAELAKQPEMAVTAQFLSGEISACQGDYQEAARTYEQALREKPDFPGGIGALAQALNATRNRDRLIGYLVPFIANHPDIIEAYNVLGFAYGAEKKWDDAEKVLREGLARDPKSVSTYEILAGVYRGQNKPAETVDVYRQGLTALPDNSRLTMGLVQHYLEAKEVDSAIALLSETVQKNPASDWLANNLAALLADYRTDPQSLQQAVELSKRFQDSSNPNALDTHAWASLQAGETARALPLLRKVVADAPNIAPFRYHLGVAYARAGDTTSAKKELAKALELAKKQGEFTGIARARELLKELADTAPVSTATPGSR